MSWRHTRAAVLAATAALGGADVGAQTCTPITAVPYTIAAPGRYCLGTTLVYPSATGAAITIAADEVTLDLGWYGELKGTAGARTRAVGVLARNQRRVKLRGGTIRGFRYGVLFSDNIVRSEQHVIDGVKVWDSTAVGISLTGANSTITNNRVSNTGGDTPFAVGISQAGSFVTMKFNGVWRTAAWQPGGYAAGFDLTHGSNQIVFRNSANEVTGHPSYGFRCGAAFAAPASKNRVTGATIPFSSCDPPVTANPSPYPDPNPNPYPYPGPYPYPYPYPYPFGPTELAYGGLIGILAGTAAFGTRRWWLA